MAEEQDKPRLEDRLDAGSINCSSIIYSSSSCSSINQFFNDTSRGSKEKCVCGRAGRSDAKRKKILSPSFYLPPKYIKKMKYLSPVKLQSVRPLSFFYKSCGCRACEPSRAESCTLPPCVCVRFWLRYR